MNWRPIYVDRASRDTATYPRDGLRRTERGGELLIKGVVHVNSVLPPDAMVPIGWIAVGNPAEILPPGAHDQIWPIQKSMDFRGTVWGVDRSVSRAQITRRYAQGLKRHAGDRLVDEV